jgi:predicted transcriptional regulator
MNPDFYNYMNCLYYIEYKIKFTRCTASPTVAAAKELCELGFVYRIDCKGVGGEYRYVIKKNMINELYAFMNVLGYL